MADVVELLDFLLDVRHRQALEGPAREVAFQQPSHVVDRHVHLEELHLVDDLRDGALQFAQVRVGVLGDVQLDFVGDRERLAMLRPAILLNERLDDAELRLDFRRLDVERAAGVEAA